VKLQNFDPKGVFDQKFGPLNFFVQDFGPLVKKVCHPWSRTRGPTQTPQAIFGPPGLFEWTI
jgi:hypothetical protein